MPTFAGTYTNTFLTTDPDGNPAITLDTTSLFDSATGDFDAKDSTGLFFDTGGEEDNISSEGEYAFANSFSLDAIYDATFQIRLDMISDDPYDLFDAGRGAVLFEDAQAPFDANAPTNNSAFIYVGASDTSLGAITSYSQISQQGTFKGRFFKFKAELNSLDNNARPLVTNLVVKLVLEKRSERGDDITSGAGTLATTFTNPLYDIPTIIVTGQNMATGDYFLITSKSKTGFSLTFYNSSNTIVSRIFDYQAIGYGLKN
jgi:hypothetical protein